MDKLQFLEAITGSICTMIVSVICPALFYYKLFLSKKPKKIISPATSSKHLNTKFKCPVTNDMDDRMSVIDVCFDDLDFKDEQHKLGLRIILYLYVIMGTVIGGYMFGTDLINAISE